MPETLSALLAPVIAIVAVVFLVIRLRFFSDDHPDGRYLFVIGGVLVIVAALWQAIKLSPDYHLWFVPNAYGYIDISQVLALALGVLLISAALALYHDFWQIDRDEITEQQGKLSILEQLQEDARQPYQVTDLMSMGLREILLQWSECAGVVFLVHRERRQFVLIDSSRLDKQETALMEYLPLRRNIVAEALDDGRPVIGGSFTFVDRTGTIVPSRFSSSIVLPLVSGMEQIGGILLLSEESRYFTRSDVKILAPVAGWLAERARSARLNRELSGIRRQMEEHKGGLSDLTARVTNVAKAIGGEDAVTDFCRALAGVGGSQSVHLCGMRNGGLVIHGGSEPLPHLSDNFRTALVGALDRRKPLILNQEATDDEGTAVIVASTLVSPVGNNEQRDALLFRKEAPPFEVDDALLRQIEVYARLAAPAMNWTDIRRLDLARRIGFDKVLHLLTSEEMAEDASSALTHFARTVADIMPQRTLAVTFVRETSGVLRLEAAVRCDISGIDAEVLPGEGSIGQSIAQRKPLFVVGKRAASAEFSSYREETQRGLVSIFGERGRPELFAVCPVSRLEDPLGVVVFYFYGLTPDQLHELQRLVTLASGLYSLRLSVATLQTKSLRSEAAVVSGAAAGELVNRINNHLSAIMGSAELAASRDDLSGDARRQMKSVVAESEQLAALVRRSFQGIAEASESHPRDKKEPELGGLADAIRGVLNQSRISGNVYMAGGRAREIDVQLDTQLSSVIPDGDIRALFEGAINRFAALSKDEEMITVAAYQQGEHVYLDLSRHPKNFPPVRRVVGFGDYRLASEALQERPGDVFLSRVKDDPCFYAHDRHSDTPTFLSFRFPVSEKGVPLRREEDRLGTHFSILAIDDETIILDLVSAMCQSLGYSAATARSGEEGLQWLRRRRFDLVLTDLAMPGLSGLEVAHEVQKVQPGVPVVLVTGWQATVSQPELDRAGIVTVLSKPFRIEQLTDIIQSMAARKR